MSIPKTKARIHLALVNTKITALLTDKLALFESTWGPLGPYYSPPELQCLVALPGTEIAYLNHTLHSPMFAQLLDSIVHNLTSLPSFSYPLPPPLPLPFIFLMVITANPEIDIRLRVSRPSITLYINWDFF